MVRCGRYTLCTQHSPRIAGFAAVGGKKEAAGPLGTQFAQTFADMRLQEPTWEQAEAAMQAQSCTLALQNAGLSPQQLDVLFAGDLLNQCTASSFGLKELQVPLLGQYGACSTIAQALLLAATFTDCGAAAYAGAVTSSHFCAAERQFRLPLEYGGQRTPTAQWTATASGAVIVSCRQGLPVEITRMTVGSVADLGVTDPANMGAAMAPAAAETLEHFFADTATLPADYDAIFTGDLGEVGSRLLYTLTRQDGLELETVHRDCGLLLFDRDRQDVHAGGSGCGCSAAVLCTHILPKLVTGEWQRVLFMATGALMSTTTSQQGLSIPGIAHLVMLTHKKPEI